MPDRYLSHKERCRRVDAMLERFGWTWYRLAQEMGCDYMTVRRHFDIKWRGKRGAMMDPRLSLIRCLAVATNTSMGFWLDREAR